MELLIKELHMQNPKNISHTTITYIYMNHGTAKHMYGTLEQMLHSSTHQDLLLAAVSL